MEGLLEEMIKLIEQNMVAEKSLPIIRESMCLGYFNVVKLAMENGAPFKIEIFQGIASSSCICRSETHIHVFKRFKEWSNDPIYHLDISLLKHAVSEGAYISDPIIFYGLTRNRGFILK